MATILIVEDVESMRELLKLVLKDYVIRTACNLPEARIEISRNRPDLVLLDEVLPGESSLDLIVDLIGQSIPVYLMTSIQDAKHVLPKRVLGRLQKPGWNSLEADRSRLLQAVGKAISSDSA